MSGGTSCKDRKAHRTSWRVLVRRANYSELVCLACGAVWRTKAAYVDQVDDA